MQRAYILHVKGHGEKVYLIEHGPRKLAHFSKEKIQMVNKLIKRCSTSLVSWERKIKITVRDQYILSYLQKI